MNCNCASDILDRYILYFKNYQIFVAYRIFHLVSVFGRSKPSKDRKGGNSFRRLYRLLQRQRIKDCAIKIHQAREGSLKVVLRIAGNSSAIQDLIVEIPLRSKYDRICLDVETFYQLTLAFQILGIAAYSSLG